MNKKSTKRKPLTQEQIDKRTKTVFKRKIRNIFTGMGFTYVPTNDHEMVIGLRKVEIDALFIFENIWLLCEDTIKSANIKEHIRTKNEAFGEIKKNLSSFQDKLIELFPDKAELLNRYDVGRIKVYGLYVSKEEVTLPKKLKVVLDFNEVQSYYMQEDKLILYNKTRLFKIRVDICSDFDYTILNPNWRLNSMKQLGMRLRALREGIGLSQSKFADVIGSTQSSINRYENGQATPTVELLRKYADYFDVSMDYIFARCDDPHGKLYEAKPPVDANNPELRKFVEMCFDPESPMNEKLKEAMLKMLGEAKA